MVIRIYHGLAAAWLLAQETPQTPFQRLDPQTRVKVLAAFAAFVILGIGLVLLAWVGARVTRRYMNQGPSRPLDMTEVQDDWATKPLVPPDKPQSNSGEET
jgi:hypothetical protein